MKDGHERAAKIREEYSTGDISMNQLARKYGVSRSLIHKIIHGRVVEPFRSSDFIKSFPRRFTIRVDSKEITLCGRY